jgi:hypothetical protein
MRAKTAEGITAPETQCEAEPGTPAGTHSPLKPLELLKDSPYLLDRVVSDCSNALNGELLSHPDRECSFAAGVVDRPTGSQPHPDRQWPYSDRSRSGYTLYFARVIVTLARRASEGFLLFLAGASG